MAQQILRSADDTTPNAVTFGTTVASSTALHFVAASAFAVFVPAGQPSTTVSWYGSYSSNGPWAPIVLSSGTSATTTIVPDKIFISPPELFPVHYIKGVGSTAVTATIMTKG